MVFSNNFKEKKNIFLNIFSKIRIFLAAKCFTFHFIVKNLTIFYNFFVSFTGSLNHRSKISRPNDFLDYYINVDFFLLENKNQ